MLTKIIFSLPIREALAEMNLTRSLSVTETVRNEAVAER